MKNLPLPFIELATYLASHKINAYLIGSSSRDFLLGKDIDDYDIAVDCPIENVAPLFEKKMDKYLMYGSIVVTYKNNKFDITSFRKEEKYKDHRHPSSISFTNNMNEDFIRRDFTINAIYIDLKGNIFDFSSGVSDLNGCLIRMIGDPKVRIKEDPLRILRAIRFSLIYDFDLEESLEFAIKRYGNLLSQISSGKIESELQKMRKGGVNELEIKKAFSKFNITMYYKAK